uniref:GB1/RHD3-type G domain-containing protein n=1 Tax=Panagrolaimus davidi TaxID=227884 RepID=A0A914QSQ0_9BILA
MSTQNRAVQIVEHLSNNEFRANKKLLDEIYGDPRVADLPLVVLCIAGAARKGKSFILNFFLDYLIHKEQHPSEPWELNDDTRLAGFEFRDGEDPTTLGIWAWNHIFVIEQEDGQKVAVSLIDSQGTFDDNTSYQDCSTIFAMACIFSSVMCFNVFTDLQQDKLNDFAAFVDHAKKIVDNLGGSGKLFQDLVFIVRDFCFKKYLDDDNGGQMYVEKVLGNVKVKELQQLRDGLNSSYERKFGFVFPHPGETVALEKTSNIAEMNPKFVYRAKEMVETLLSQNELQIKRVGPTEMYCKNMSDYILMCVKCFNDNQEFAPKAVQTVNREFMINLELKRASQTYDELMGKAFIDCKTGYTNDKLVALHEKAFEKIQDDILKRIKNEDIVTEVIQRSIDHLKNIFYKYKEKNEMLVETEKKRIELIEAQRRHEEKLARLKVEAEEKLAKEKMEHELRQLELYEQQEKERRQHEKEQAEIVAKLVHANNDHKKKQAEIRRQHEIESQKRQAEIEKQRVREAKKHEEEMRRIQCETDRIIAQGKQEMENEMQRMENESNRRIAEAEARNRKELEEQKKSKRGFFGSFAKGASDGIDTAIKIGTDCGRDTHEYLGAFVTGAAVPVGLIAGTVVGAAKGVGSVFETIFS